MNTENPIFSLAYTSARATILPSVVKMWNERSSLNSHEWCIGVDADKKDVLEAAQAAAAAHPNIKIIINNGAPTCVAGWNAAAEETKGKIIIAVADDFSPPQDWDKALLDIKPAGWEDGEHVVKVEDGYVHNVFVLAILTRKRYEKFRYIFYPKYLSLFCDTEFGTVAQRDGVVIDAQHLLFEHMHPDCHKRTRDTVDVKHASKERWNMGEMLYNFRRGIGFPIDDGPMAKIYAERAEAARKEAEQLKKSQPIINKLNSEKYVAYLQVTKDDLCLLDVCKRLMQEGVLDFCFSQPDKYWSGESIAEEHKKEVLDVIKALQVEGAVVHHKIFAVDSYTLPGDTRILIETRVRNDSLSWIRSLGYQHILIVDGDELWVRGTLQIIKAYVEQGHKVISVRMTPVIGLPGYPVEASTDVAVVYVGPGNTFKVCRSPYVAQTVIPRPLIYHFTGTRKGMDETVAKHRRSGHYDDPDYDFEEFIEKVLPNVKPGFKHTWPAGHQGLHFYKNYQIWPSVRQWTEKELEDMPAAVRPYLGSAPV